MILDRQAARARCDAATPGPWKWETTNDYHALVQVGGLNILDVDGYEGEGGYEGDVPDEDFIAHARTDLPAALDELDAKDAEIERLREQLEEATQLSAITNLNKGRVQRMME